MKQILNYEFRSKYYIHRKDSLFGFHENMYCSYILTDKYSCIAFYTLFPTSKMSF